MKLTVFNSETLPQGTFGGGNKTPKISMHYSGAVRINAAAVELLGLKEGDKIAIGQDEDAPENWFVFKSPDGYAVRPIKTEKTFGFNCQPLGRMLLECFSIPEDKKSISAIVATKATTIDKVKYFGLLFKLD